MSLSRPAAEIEVLFDGVPVTLARVLTVQQSTGAQVNNVATFEYEGETGGTVNWLQGIQVHELVSSHLGVDEVEVIVKTRDGTRKTIHWGKVVASSISIAETGAVRFTSRLDDHLIGPDMLLREEVVYPDGTRSMVTSEDMVFNPLVDGRTVPNMWNLLPTYNRFVHPESLPPGIFADPWIGLLIPEEYWSLADAALYLCWRMNSKQKYVQNPTRGNVAATLGFHREALCNHRLDPSGSLPQLLDSLIRPYGFQWRVDFYEPCKRRIIFEERGITFPRKSLKMQPFDEPLDTDKTHVAGIDLNFDVANQAANRVVAFGDFERVESTFELVPAWDPQYDDTPPSQLRLDSPLVAANPALRRVWRDWVLNEGGDYTGLRPTITGAYDLSSMFGHLVTSRRREFEPTVTLQRDGSPAGEHQGVFVEIYDGNDWIPATALKGQSIQLLKRECGIRFANSGEPPVSLMMLGLDTLKIRVTATVRSDIRIFGEAKATRSLIPDQRTRVVYLGDRYQYRRVHDSSVLRADIDAGLLLNGGVDMRADVEELAKELLASWNQATIQGTVTLEGIDWNEDYWAHGITGLEERNLGFRTTAMGLPERYPNVIGIRYDIQQQRTQLDLDTYFRQRVA